MRARAQRSRAAFGTCCKVGTRALRMDMRSGKEGGLEDGGRRPGVVGGEGVGEALGGVA